MLWRENPNQIRERGTQTIPGIGYPALTSGKKKSPTYLYFADKTTKTRAIPPPIKKPIRPLKRVRAVSFIKLPLKSIVKNSPKTFLGDGKKYSGKMFKEEKICHIIRAVANGKIFLNIFLICFLILYIVQMNNLQDLQKG